MVARPGFRVLVLTNYGYYGWQRSFVVFIVFVVVFVVNLHFSHWNSFSRFIIVANYTTPSDGECNSLKCSYLASVV